MKSKVDKPSQEKAMVDKPSQEKAMEFILYANRLVDPSVFDKIIAAVNEKNQDAFLKECLKVGIPKELAVKFWKVALRQFPEGHPGNIIPCW
jgi:hypothetical protein